MRAAVINRTELTPSDLDRWRELADVPCAPDPLTARPTRRRYAAFSRGTLLEIDDVVRSQQDDHLCRMASCADPAPRPPTPSRLDHEHRDPDPAVSFSVTFFTGRTDREAAVHEVNAQPRRLRVTRSALGAHPRRDLVKQGLWRGSPRVLRAARPQRR